MKISRILATKGTETITIHPDKTIREAIFLMEKNNIGALPVLDAADRLVGILTERDIIRNLVEDEAVVRFRPLQLDYCRTGNPDGRGMR